MSTAGPTIAGTGADDNSVGTPAWSNPGNITANDSSFATCVMSVVNTPSHYLKATNFGFSITAGSTINGIQVDISRKADATGSLHAKDVHVYIVKGGTVQTTQDKADTSTNYPTTETLKTYGSSSDLWGLSWTDTDITASNFGVVLQSQNAASGTTVSVNYIQITITYTLPVTVTMDMWTPQLVSQYRIPYNIVPY